MHTTVIRKDTVVTYARPKLTRTTINLLPAAVEALVRLAMRYGLSKTQAINHAVVVYAKLSCELEDGSVLLIRRPNGDVDKLIVT